MAVERAQDCRYQDIVAVWLYHRRDTVRESCGDADARTVVYMTLKATNVTPRDDGKFDVQVGFYRDVLCADELRTLVTEGIAALAPNGVECVTCGATGAILPRRACCTIESVGERLRDGLL